MKNSKDISKHGGEHLSILTPYFKTDYKLSRPGAFEKLLQKRLKEECIKEIANTQVIKTLLNMLKTITERRKQKCIKIVIL